MTLLGRPLRAEQQLIADVGLERIDGPGSPWAYNIVDTIVGRRFGKTVLELGIPLWRAHLGDLTLPTGKVVPFRGAHTAQNLTAARRRFLADHVEPLRAFLTPEEWEPRVHEVLAASQTSLSIDLADHPPGVLPDGRHEHAQRTIVVPPTYDGVRGEGYLHLGFDEVLTMTLAEGDLLTSASRPTMAEFFGHAQTWRVSNVGLFSDERTWLRQIRDRGRASITEGTGRGRAYFEYTIPDDVDPLDEQTWWTYYPPLAGGWVGVEQLRDDLAEMSPEAFAAEYLGRWPAARAAAEWLALTKADWTAARTLDEQPAGTLTTLGVDIDPYGRSSSIVSAATVPDADGATLRDVALVEVLDHRPRSGWVVDALVDHGRPSALVDQVDWVVVDDYGAGHDLIAELEKVPAIARKLLTTKSVELVSACYGFDAGLRERTIRWRASDYHEALTAAAAAAQRTSGKAWQWERRVAVSQTPILGATLAVWALGRAPIHQEAAIY